MKNEKLLEAMGYMDEEFLEENLKSQETKRIVFFNQRGLRNLVAAVLAVALLGCVVLASSVPAAPEPDWEPYEGADVVLDYLFGTGRYSANEGEVWVKTVWVDGTFEDGTAKPKELRIPITSSASREPVSEELAALVRPYFIPVEKSITDPTGTMTLELMTYFYEPETRCGVAYVRLTDPTGEFGGYVLDTPVVEPGEEIPEDRPRRIDSYLQLFEKLWGKKYPQWSHAGMRLVEEASDEYNWTFAVSFWPEENTVGMDIGFRMDLDIDYPQYRISMDLDRSPTMDTVSFRNASVRETVIISPVSMRIDGSGNGNHRSDVSSIVIHFKDGSSYVVADKETCVYGWAANGYRNVADGRDISYLFSNIIDIRQIQYVQIDGINYVQTNP